jgi:hypothetical protein
MKNLVRAGIGQWSRSWIYISEYFWHSLPIATYPLSWSRSANNVAVNALVSDATHTLVPLVIGRWLSTSAYPYPLDNNVLPSLTMAKESPGIRLQSKTFWINWSTALYFHDIASKVPKMHNPKRQAYSRWSSHMVSLNCSAFDFDSRLLMKLDNSGSASYEVTCVSQYCMWWMVWVLSVSYPSWHVLLKYVIEVSSRDGLPRSSVTGDAEEPTHWNGMTRDRF